MNTLVAAQFSWPVGMICAGGRTNPNLINGLPSGIPEFNGVGDGDVGLLVEPVSSAAGGVVQLPGCLVGVVEVVG